MEKLAGVISEIRSFNRFYTNILGLLSQHILDSPYTLTEVRVLLEIDCSQDCTANQLMAQLDIDRGYMSRILKCFENQRLIRKESSVVDGRSLLLFLTPLGKEILAELEEKSNRQIEKLIGHLNETEQKKLVSALKYIKNTLLDGIYPVTIRSYQAKDLDYIIQSHRRLYEKEYGFASDFGDYVEKYVRKFHESHDEAKEQIWIAEMNGKPVGLIALVRVDDRTAQLRWFLVEPEMRGRKLGHRLMKTVLVFCKSNHYQHILLWTVSLLAAARHLYQSYGFRLTETKENRSWTKEPILEERWDLDL